MKEKSTKSYSSSRELLDKLQHKTLCFTKLQKSIAKLLEKKRTPKTLSVVLTNHKSFAMSKFSQSRGSSHTSLYHFLSAGQSVPRHSLFGVCCVSLLQVGGKKILKK